MHYSLFTLCTIIMQSIIYVKFLILMVTEFSWDRMQVNRQWYIVEMTGDWTLAFDLANWYLGTLLINSESVLAMSPLLTSTVKWNWNPVSRTSSYKLELRRVGSGYVPRIHLIWSTENVTYRDDIKIRININT